MINALTSYLNTLVVAVNRWGAPLSSTLFLSSTAISLAVILTQNDGQASLTISDAFSNLIDGTFTGIINYLNSWLYIKCYLV